MLQLLKKTVFIILAALSVAACSSSDPEYVDPEAHEKTIQLNEKYGPVLVGTWHFEKIGEKQRYFERLTFQADGTLTGMRKCQKRELVTINGEQVYTDWEKCGTGWLGRRRRQAERHFLRHLETALLGSLWRWEAKLSGTFCQIR